MKRYDLVAWDTEAGRTVGTFWGLCARGGAHVLTAAGLMVVAMASLYRLP